MHKLMCETMLADRNDLAANVENLMVEIIETRESYGSDFSVYVGGKLIRTCPSRGMANEVASQYR